MRTAAVSVGQGKFWIELDGLAAVGHCLIVVASSHVGRATVDVVSSSRIELDRLRVIGDGAIEVILMFVCHATIEVRTRYALLIFSVRVNELRAARNPLIVGTRCPIAPRSDL